MMLMQSRGAVFRKPKVASMRFQTAGQAAAHTKPEVLELSTQDYACVALPFLKFWSNGEKHACTIPEVR